MRHCMKRKKGDETGWSVVYKWVIAIMVSTVLLMGAETESEEGVSPMEMLLFKIGFTALVDEFEQEKNATRSNSERIAALEKNFELMVKFMEMTRGELLKDKDIQVTPGSSYGIYNTEAMKKELSVILENYKKEMDHSKDAELQRLRSEVTALKRDILVLAQKGRMDQPEEKAEPKSTKRTISHAGDGRFRVVVDEMNIRQKRSAASASLGVLKRDETVVFDSCDRFGWCTLQGRKGYVPKYLFLPAD